MSDDVLSIDYGERDGSTVVRLRGRLDSETSPRFQTEVVGRCAGKGVILDMTELRYISSAGLRAILVLRKSGSRIRVENATGLVKEVLEISDFDTLMG
ncbi:MAG: STAS domain-containing protein [Candidatus Methanomethylophilaceae archaeon]